tara:strand:+ start:6760 stop:9168 length:2409 start_codon:yes stop_codon:yes gene_type:complete
MGIQQIGIESTVYKKKGTDLLTGVMSEQGPEGWKWDRYILQNQFDSSTMHESYVGGWEYNLSDGISIFDWNNFAYSSISLEEIAIRKEEDLNIWQPRYSVGEYSLFGKKMKLYSSHSISQSAKISDGVFELELDEDFKKDSITVGIYKRNIYNTKYLFREWVSNPESKYNYSTEGNLLKTNNSDSISRVRSFDSGEELRMVGEGKGNCSVSGRSLFSKYFPIREGSLKVFGTKDNKVIEFKDYTDSEIPETEYGYKCDYDLGIIFTSGYKAPDVILSIDLSTEASEIFAGPVSKMKQYPEEGEIRIGTEIIYYQNRSDTKFYNCVRLNPSSHVKNSIIFKKKEGLSLGEEYEFYITYDTSPRIEYEMSEHSIRIANRNKFLDLHPFSNLNNNGIVQLSLTDINVKKIDLKVNADNIGGNIFGPAFFGIDSKFLTATVYDNLNNEVEGVEVTIHIARTGPGYLNTNSKTFKDTSNSEGEIYSSYSCPYDWDEISKEVFKVTHSNGNTVFDIEEIQDIYSVDPNNITIYEIMKHDPVFGYIGNEFEVDSFGNEITIGSAFFLESWLRVTSSDFEFIDSFEGSKCTIRYTDGGESTCFIKSVRTSQVPTEEKQYLLILDRKLAAIQNGKIVDKIWIQARKTVQEPLQPNSLEWNTYHKIGALKVLYSWNEQVRHPITRAIGAYYPVRPSKLISNSSLELKGEVKIPDAFDRDNLLGGYRIVSSSVVEFYASCKDPLTNRTIVSNIIKLRLDLPKYLNGVSFDEGLPVPYGFGLVSESLEVGTGLGGQNFISINPIEENILTLNIK